MRHYSMLFFLSHAQSCFVIATDLRWLTDGRDKNL